MTLKVLTLSNEKGGVGKTTIALHIAAGMALRGWRVLLIDADAQAHATISLGLPKEPGLYNLLARDADFETVLREPARERWASPESGGGRLLVLPGNVETRVIPMVIDDALLFRQRLAELDGLVDLVVIDTAPTPSLLHGSIYLATTDLVYPTQCEALALDGLAQSIAHKNALNETRISAGLGPLRVMGIQPTMYRQQTDAHDHGLRLLTKEFKALLWPSIPQRTVWVERAWAGRTMFAYRPKGREKLADVKVAEAEAWALVDRVQKGLIA